MNPTEKISESSISIVQVDFLDERHSRDLCLLLDTYASDPMGGGQPLAPALLATLPAQLARLSNAVSWLCYVNQQPAGLANCFIGFSTFQARPLLNIHDFAIMPAYRGQGLSQRLLAVIEQYASQHQCCKLTLEVLQGNRIAQHAYRKYGFAGYQLDTEAGQALFWEKRL